MEDTETFEVKGGGGGETNQKKPHKLIYSD